MTETKKMLEIIHNNCRKQKVERIKKEKKEQKQSKLLVIGLGVLFIATLIVYNVYCEKSVNDCMKRGSSETFCRYAGE